MLVEVRPIETKRWHGKTKEENFARPKTIQALVDAQTMQYATGLTDEDIQKLKDKKVNYDLSPHYDPEKPHEFWDSSVAKIKLENATMFFNTKNPIDFIKVKIMKASKYVANSMREYENGMFPEATHVIYDEAEEAEVAASKVALRNEAVIQTAKLSKDRKTEIILILDGKILKGQSDNFITVAMDKLIKEQPENVLKYINMDAEEVSNHALVLEALQKSVLRQEGHKIYYFDSLLGTDDLSVTEYLSDDENQDLKLRIMKAVNE